MLRRFPKSGRRGFTLIEVLVTMFSLVVIVVAAGQLLFATRRSTQRQQYQVDARQTARAAVDYVNFLIRGATDFNIPAPGGTNPSTPGALLAWYWWGTFDKASHPCPGAGYPGNGCFQATWDNVTDTSLADAGTDIITFARSDNGQVFKVSPNNGSAFDYYSLPTPPTVTLGIGPLNAGTNSLCSTGSSATFDYFQTATGGAGSTFSPILMLLDDQGQWGFMRITDYESGTNGSCCTSQTIVVGTDLGVSASYNPPGTPHPSSPTAELVAGLRYTSLRVCQGWLEQKDGIFDPSDDGTAGGGGGTGAHACTSAGWNTGPWTQVLPNVEDLQFAYIYNTGTTGATSGSGGTIYNNGNLALGTTGNVPSQAGPGGGSGAATDITRVIGVRITVTGRSASQFSLEQGRFRKLPAENNPNSAATPDEFYRFQASSVAMLRSRTIGS